MILRILLFLALSFLVACQPVPVAEIYWNDGDSGVVDGVEFRLHNYDAPETGPIGEEPGNARCALEQERGKRARAFVRSFTRSGALTITRHYGTDRYGRIEVDISVNDQDVGATGERLGHYQSWKHFNGRALEERPDWCSL